MKVKLLLAALVSLVMASAMLVGCSGSSSEDWKKAFEDFGYGKYEPRNEYVHESDYSVTEFNVEKVDGSQSEVKFTATVENDYFSIKLNGRGAEGSKDEKTILGSSINVDSVVAKKAIDNFADSKTWFESAVFDGVEFTLDESGDKCSADINRDIDTWYGTVHVEGNGRAVLSEDGWKFTSNITEQSVSKMSEEVLGVYKLADGNNTHNALVTQFEIVLDDEGHPAVKIQQPDFSYRELYTGLLVYLSRLKEWHSAARESTLILSDDKELDLHSDTVDGRNDCKYEAQLLKCSYPAEDNADWTIELSADIAFHSEVEGEVEVEGFSSKGRSSKTNDTRSLCDMDGRDITVLGKGTYVKQKA